MSKQPKKPASPAQKAQREAHRTAAFLALNSTGTPLLRRENCPWWETLSQCFALVMLCLFPLVMSTKTYGNITKTRFDAFAVLAVAYGVLCLFILIAYPFGSGPKRRHPPAQRPTLPQLFLAGYMVWAVISAVASPYEGVWLGQSRYEGLLSLLLYALLFLLLSFWGEYTDGYFHGIAAMGLVMGLLGFIQTFGGTFLYPEGYTYWNSHFLSTAGNIDCVAGYLCILIPLLLTAFVLLESRWRYLCLPGLFLLAYLLLFSDTDTAKLGLIVPVLLLPFLLDSRSHIARTVLALSPLAAAAALHALLRYDWKGELTVVAQGKFPLLVIAAAVLAAAGILLGRLKGELPAAPRTVRIAVAVLVALGIAGALVYLYGYGGDNTLLAEASGMLHGRVPDAAGSGRGYIWRGALSLIGRRPLLGGGPGTFMECFAPFQAGYQALSGTNTTVDFAHNDFIQIAVCQGLVGLALYLGFVAALLVRCLRSAFRSGVSVIFLAGLLGYLVYSFFVFSIAIVSPVFWVLAGLADKYVRQTNAAPPQP